MILWEVAPAGVTAGPGRKSNGTDRRHRHYLRSPTLGQGQHSRRSRRERHASHERGIAIAWRQSGRPPTAGAEAAGRPSRPSGLTDETIRTAGLYRAVGRRVSELLRWDADKENGLRCCLCIPYRDSNGNPIPLCADDGSPAVDKDGNPLHFTRIKPGKPRPSKGRKGLSEYECPLGVSPVPPYFPPGTLAALKDPTIPLLFTEGEKKSLKADQDGFPCIGLPGVYGWGGQRPKGEDGKRKGKLQLSSELAAIPWQGREVCIVFDSDLADNYNVQRAEWRLSQELANRGANVKVVRLPPGDVGPDGKPAKVGLDDFLVARNPDALRELIAAAVAPEEPVPAKVAAAAAAGVANEADDDPHLLARLFLCPGELPIGPAPAIKPEMLTLRYWREDWLEYKHQAYRVTPAKEVAARLTAKVKAVFDWLNKLDMEKWRADGGGGDGEDGKKKAGPPEARRGHDKATRRCQASPRRDHDATRRYSAAGLARRGRPVPRRGSASHEERTRSPAEPGRQPAAVLLPTDARLLFVQRPRLRIPPRRTATHELVGVPRSAVA